MLTEQEIHAYLALCEKATPGPWEFVEADDNTGSPLICAPDCHEVHHVYRYRNPIGNGQFTAASRTIGPALAEEVLRLRTALKNAHGANMLLAWNPDDVEGELIKERAAHAETKRELESMTELQQGTHEHLESEVNAHAATEQRRKLAVEALEPFRLGGDWGTWLAWLTNGAPTREQGVEAAKTIVNWRARVGKAIAAQEDSDED